MLDDLFEHSRKKYTEIYELDPAHFLSAQGLTRKACLKKTKFKLELLTDIDLLLMIDKGMREGICHSVTKANNKHITIILRKITSGWF